jgi:dTDP-4-dehydrorhamnose reductase
MELILGSKGMLGGQLMRTLNKPVGWDKGDVDVTDFEALRKKILELDETPAVIINCIAYNDVDGAEDNVDSAFSLNAHFVGKLAEFCKQIDVPLMHFSTNYVFDGEKGEYSESDQPGPLSVYAHSKFQGEQLLRQETDKYYLVRTAVLFGAPGLSPDSKKSFLDTMLDLGEKQQEIKVVSDELNSLTLVSDLADGVKYLLDSKKPYGIYHIANSGSASWYDIAKELFFFVQKNVTLVPVMSSDFPRKARRPKNAVLLNTKLYKMQDWKQALREYLLKERKLKQSN